MSRVGNISQSDPKDELNRLLNEAITMACRLIEKHGCHLPFAMTITSNGERSDIVADDRETRDAETLFESVRTRVEQGVQNGEYRAVAIAKNVAFRYRLSEEPTDSIQISLDHEHTSSSTCYLPYKRVRGTVVAGELFATEPVLRFFLK